MVVVTVPARMLLVVDAAPRVFASGLTAGEGLDAVLTVLPVEAVILLDADYLPSALARRDVMDSRGVLKFTISSALLQPRRPRLVQAVPA